LFVLIDANGEAGEASVDVVKEREIIRLWNRLRLLQREGRAIEAVRRQLEKALVERESAA
jgi:hypothetical protein